VRAAGVVLALSLAAPLLGCGSARAPTEAVILSQPQPQSVFAGNAQPDGRWRKAHPSRPVAILLGSATTSRILGLRRAALEASCVRRKPRVRVAFDVSLGSGGVTMAYRFDGKAERSGTTRVRGRSRNLMMIDYPVTATAFFVELTASSTLKVKAKRLPYDFHEADFRWDRADPALKEVLAACQPGAQHAARPEPAPDDADDDEALDEAINDVLPAD
jgi:hypothetical protein